jgi:hypothetical protein
MLQQPALLPLINTSHPPRQPIHLKSSPPTRLPLLPSYFSQPPNYLQFSHLHQLSTLSIPSSFHQPWLVPSRQLVSLPSIFILFLALSFWALLVVVAVGGDRAGLARSQSWCFAIGRSASSDCHKTRQQSHMASDHVFSHAFDH